jgi:hypothetical protein
MMSSTSRRALGPLCLSLLSACSAERWADRGIGGTGGIADRGIGGTGITGDLADRGIGGTGIGGLGLIGTVTAFGSIWVNGVRLALPDRLRVTREGAPTVVSEIKLGHVVVARAGGLTDGAIEALSLDLRFAVAGRVERREADTLWILGQRCVIDESVADAGLRDAVPGALVAVSGLRRGDGAITVSRIDPWPATRGWLLRGAGAVRLEREVSVAGVPVTLRSGLDLPEDAQGKEWLATGSLSGGALLAETLRVEPANPFGGGVGRLLVETYLDAAGRAPALLGAPAIALGEAGTRVVYAARVTGLAGGLAASGVAPAAAIGQRELPGGSFGRLAPGLGRPGAVGAGRGAPGPGGASGMGGPPGPGGPPLGPPPLGAPPPGMGRMAPNAAPPPTPAFVPPPSARR